MVHLVSYYASPETPDVTALSADVTGVPPASCLDVCAVHIRGGTLTETRLKLKMAQRSRMTTQEAIDLLTALYENYSDAENVSDHKSDGSWICETGSSTSESEEGAMTTKRAPQAQKRSWQKQQSWEILCSASCFACIVSYANCFQVQAKKECHYSQLPSYISYHRDC
ncbi:UNVERIFIED_CONTAM: hypothetical protein FKN15_051111 [Acipenser sinensis]